MILIRKQAAQGFVNDAWVTGTTTDQRCHFEKAPGS
jgi:hypothetical protein